MAVYIEINKLSENDLEAVYEFLPDADVGRKGLLRVDKETGKVTETTPSPGDERQFFFLRAAMKLSSHYEQGELPEATCWAS